jgi:hypothetical protein
MMAMAILLAGIAQTAHHHESEFPGGASDVHCLLCLYAAGAAGPPAFGRPARLSQGYCIAALPCANVHPPSHRPVPYEARGPPHS